MKNFKNLLFFISLCLFGLSSCQDDMNEITPEAGELNRTEIESRQVTLEGWVPSPCADITIFISPNCGPNMSNGVEDAAVAYNQTNTAIHMTITTEEATADIVINCEDFADDNLAGLGEWPDEDGEIGGQIFLNTDFEDECDDPCYYQGLLMHELGHNLGLAHNGFQAGINLQVGSWTFDPGTGTFTNDNPEITILGVQIPGTDDRGNNRGSVFNASILQCGWWVFNNPECTFSNDDIKALEFLYPLPSDPCDCPNAFGPYDCLLEDLCYCDCFLEDQWTNYSYHEYDIDCSDDCGQFEGTVEGSYYVEYCTKKMR